MSRSNKIIIDEWKETVNKAKKSSASSIFSQQICTIYKCALESKRMTNHLVSFYNILIEQGYYPKRW